MIGPYECRQYGVVTKLSDQVCQPRSAPCGCVLEQLPFVCGRRGHPAEQPDMLCDSLVLS